jgi:hypothetical protein
MRDDGPIKGSGYSWPEFNRNIVTYYNALEAELRELAG